MYIPNAFRIDDPEKLASFIAGYSFATLVTSPAGVPFASHLPMRSRCSQGACVRLVSHMAKANPQWRHFADSGEVLVVFTGPHAYISPTWYTTEPAVPTWNYAAVHVYGQAYVLEDPAQVVDLLTETIEHYESFFPSPWHGELPLEYRDRMIEAIVPFEVRVSRIEGKFKLGQNRSEADMASVYRNLLALNDPEMVKLAELMVSEGMIDDAGADEHQR